MKRGFRAVALLLCGLVVVLAACGHGNNSTTGTTVTTPPGNVPWTFVGGPSLVGQSGAYGTQGVGAATNQPGSRDSAATWTDSAGNLWLFGGGSAYDVSGTVGALNDLWKYSPSTGFWTWVAGPNRVNQSGVYGTKGTAAAANNPGARAGAATWTDSSGNLYLFGGIGYDVTGLNGTLNDLWKFNPTAGQWTWIGGSSNANAGGVYGTLGTAEAGNVPGAREGAVAWRDKNGDFWLFGGAGYDGANGNGTGTNGQLNDLWKYAPASGEWTWVAGPYLANQAASYGTVGTAAASNNPGPRQSAAGWLDASGNLWLLGGLGRDSSGASGFLNDLWKFVPSTGQWTWVSGASTVGQVSVYGTLGTAATGNLPGSRATAVAFTDAAGNLWLFGGQGFASGGTLGYLNDLWEYSPSTAQWTYQSGSTAINGVGVYGTRGTASTSNSPGGRLNAAGWYAGGKFWVFGGGGIDSASGLGQLNDLWSSTL